MTAKEYLGQAYRLDQRINANLEEVARLREMASSVSSPSWEEKTGGSRPTDPPFVRCLVKIMDLERHIDVEVDRLVDLKKQIRTVIEDFPTGTSRPFSVTAAFSTIPLRKSAT